MDKSKKFGNLYSNDIIRTGTIQDGSCFFHAVLYALSKSYRAMSQETRIKYVAQVRKQLAQNVDIEVWKNLGKGEMAKLQIIEFLWSKVQELCANDESNLKIWECDYLPQLNNNFNEIERLLTLFSEREGVENFDSTQFLKQLESQAFESFIFHLQHDWVDEFGIEIVSAFFECNVHFIQASNRKAYRTFSNHAFDRNVVLCWIDDAHYECLGRLHPNNKVQRIFATDDPFIISLYNDKNES